MNPVRRFAPVVSRLVSGRSWVVLTVLLAVTGLVLLGLGGARQTPNPPTLLVAAAGVAPAAAVGQARATSRADTPAPLPSSRPTGVRIPSLGVSASAMDLGLLPDRTLATPPDGTEVGWYTGSPTPGARGPAILAGHVTWNREPGVFFRLAELQPGDRVEVSREDGRTAVFTIDHVASYDKEEFPTAEVYDGRLPYAGLRLITCAGEFDEKTKRYPDNVVAYARFVGEA